MGLRALTPRVFAVHVMVAVAACTSTSDLSGGDGGPEPEPCGRPCTYANAEGACVEGVCRIGACLPGYRDCSGGPENGCETYVLGGDVEHCGSCETRCSFANATG